jgi:hypothetical protein
MFCLVTLEEPCLTMMLFPYADVHRFDAHQIPLEGPRGLLARVEKLLNTSPISQSEKAELLGQFARFVEGHSDV